jgi:hypothetical protein
LSPRHSYKSIATAGELATSEVMGTLDAFRRLVEADE